MFSHGLRGPRVAGEKFFFFTWESLVLSGWKLLKFCLWPWSSEILPEYPWVCVFPSNLPGTCGGLSFYRCRLFFRKMLFLFNYCLACFSDSYYLPLGSPRSVLQVSWLFPVISIALSFCSMAWNIAFTIIKFVKFTKCHKFQDHFRPLIWVLTVTLPAFSSFTEF